MSNGKKTGIERFWLDIGSVVNRYKDKASQPNSPSTFKDLIQRLGGMADIGTDLYKNILSANSKGKQLDQQGELVGVGGIPVVDSEVALEFAGEYVTILEKFEQYVREEGSISQKIIEKREDIQKTAAKVKSLHERILAFKGRLEAEKARLEAEAKVTADSAAVAKAAAEAKAAETAAQEKLASESVQGLLAQAALAQEPIQFVDNLPETEELLKLEAKKLTDRLNTLERQTPSLKSFLDLEDRKLAAQVATLAGVIDLDKGLNQQLSNPNAQLNILKQEKSDIAQYLTGLETLKSRIDYAGTDDYHVMEVYWDVQPFLSEEQQQRWEENGTLFGWNLKGTTNYLYSFVSSKAKSAIPAKTLLKNLVLELEGKAQSRMTSVEVEMHGINATIAKTQAEISNNEKVKSQTANDIEKTRGRISDIQGAIGKHQFLCPDLYARRSNIEERLASSFVSRTLAAASQPSQELPVLPAVQRDQDANASPILDFINMLLKKVNKLLEKTEKLNNKLEAFLNENIPPVSTEEDDKSKSKPFNHSDYFLNFPSM